MLVWSYMALSDNQSDLIKKDAIEIPCQVDNAKHWSGRLG